MASSKAYFVNSGITWSTVVAPAFYTTLCLAFLRLCLVGKALYYLAHNVFTCFNEFTKRSFQIFLVDFFIGAHEVFAFVVLLFTLFLAGKLDNKDLGGLETALSNFRVCWLAFTIFYGVRTISLVWSIGDLNYGVVANLYRRKMLKNFKRAKQEDEPEEVFKVSKPSKMNKFLNFMQVTPGYYTEAENKVGPGQSDAADDHDGLCMICYAQESNCLLMPCRHSGICKDCSMSTLKKKPECVFCRKPVEKFCVIKAAESGGLEVIEEIELKSASIDHARLI
jgi:Zinc finger, C3HC4 type (RING finger)